MSARDHLQTGGPSPSPLATLDQPCWIDEQRRRSVQCSTTQPRTRGQVKRSTVYDRKPAWVLASDHGPGRRKHVTTRERGMTATDRSGRAILPVPRSARVATHGQSSACELRPEEAPPPFICGGHSRAEFETSACPHDALTLYAPLTQYVAPTVNPAAPETAITAVADV
jgi:hypothetical protein